MWRSLRRPKPRGGHQLKAAELGIGLTASVKGLERPAWDMGKVLVRNRQKAWLKSETRDMGGNTPHGNTGQTGIGEGLSSQGDRGKKGTWSLGY